MYSTRSKHPRVRKLVKDYADQYFCYNMCSPEPIKNWNDGKSSIEINIQCRKFGQFYGGCTSTGGMWQDKGISSQTKSERIELDRPLHQPADHVARGELVVRLLPERWWPRPRDAAPPGRPHICNFLSTIFPFWAQFFSTWNRVNCGKISQNFSKFPKISPHDNFSPQL